MKVLFPDEYDDFGLSVTRAIRNNGQSQRTFTLGDVFYALKEIEARLGITGASETSSHAYKISTLEGLIAGLLIDVDELTNKVRILPTADLPTKIYVGILTQAGTADPTAVLKKNSLGIPVWTRTSTGIYNGLLVGAFPASTFMTSHVEVDELNGAFQSRLKRVDDDNCQLRVYDPGGNLVDNWTAIVEVRKY